MEIVRHEDRPDTSWQLARRVAAAAVMGLHGVIHLLGFLAVWELADMPDLTNSPSLFLADQTGADSTVRAFALLWLLAGTLFVVTSVALVSRRSWWRIVAPLAAAVSLVPTLIWWSDAAWGFFVSLLILLGMVGFGRSVPLRLQEEITERDFGKELTRTGS